MAERIELFQVTCPLGTAIATPITQALSMNPCVVERIEVTVPRGPSGLMGFRFRYSGQVVIPYAGSNYIVTDDEKLQWPVQGYPTNNSWSVQMYNTGLFAHTIYIRMLVNEIPARPQAPLIPITIA